MTDAPAIGSCWVLTDGKPGMENQCLGLAEALGLAPAVKRIAPRFPWSVLPPHLWLSPLSAPGPDGDSLAPPWPDLLIATGRQTAAPALAIRKTSGGRTFCVQIQNPTTGRDRFDLLAIPAHDRVDGPNVIATDGALHRVTPEKLGEGAERFASLLAPLPRPLVSVLIGGSNAQYKMTEAVARGLAANLRRLCDDHGAGLAITASRRTGAANEAILRDALADGIGTGSVWFWDGSGENPYFGLLGLGDVLAVTADSVSMVSEACSTGKPVYVIELEGGSAKFARFHDRLRARGITRPFDGTLETWTYEPLDDTARVAAEVRRRMAARA
jgi:mitochondrial fission protein ELM1